MKNRLIYILNRYSEEEASHYNHVVNLINEISRLGINVVLLIENCESTPDVDKKVQVVAQQYQDPLLRYIELFFLLKKLLSDDRFINNIFIRITSKPAIISSFLAKIKPADVYFWQSGTTHSFEKEKKYSLRKLKWYLKSTLPFIITKNIVDYFVTGPELMKEYYENEVGVNKEKIRILYNDVDIERFKNVWNDEVSKIRKALNLKNEKGVLLFVHRLSPVKRTMYYFPYILNEFYKKNDKFITLIIGNGEDKKSLQEEIISSGLEDDVKLLGEIPNKDIQYYYHLADIFINPTYEEGFPRVLLEAMASGLPIVTTDAGGIADIIDSEQLNFMVSKDDRDAFVEKLLILAESEEWQKNLSNINKRRVTKYSTQNVAKMYVDTIFNS